MPTPTPTPTRTAWRRFVGQNIKGTPAMKAKAVAHDLEVIKSESDVAVVQEFRWPWYWKTAERIVGRGGRNVKWRSSPGFARGFSKPVIGAQAALWQASVWKRIDTRLAILHEGEAGISENRYLRAVLLEDRETGLRAWFGSTHFVVGGDMPGDSPRRKAIMDLDLNALDNFLAALRRSGDPVLFQLDANLRPASACWPRFRGILRRHGAKAHGALGIEFLFTIPGRNTKVEVKRDWIIPTTRLKTDHEGRGVTFRLVRN